MNKPRVDKIQRQYEKFISESTRKNYKFYVFSRIMKRLFESYATVVSTENTTKLQSSARQWVNVQCRFVFLIVIGVKEVWATLYKVNFSLKTFYML